MAAEYQKERKKAKEKESSLIYEPKSVIFEYDSERVSVTTVIISNPLKEHLALKVCNYIIKILG
jgi:hypothetical protein